MAVIVPEAYTTKKRPILPAAQRLIPVILQEIKLLLPPHPDHIPAKLAKCREVGTLLAGEIVSEELLAKTILRRTLAVLI